MKTKPGPWARTSTWLPSLVSRPPARPPAGCMRSRHAYARYSQGTTGEKENENGKT
uniref:Uncharacterized protein n=1 Tax=Zea mays TaxID=4577 RepID=C4J899_MAIZE|nr:unknown [Zea mays]